MAKILKPLQGVRIWKNEKNKFVVFELHYTADPAKRSELFKEAAKSGLPVRKFMQEFEIKWDTYEGMPVYSDFNPDIHKVEMPPFPERGLPLLLGWDFGLTPACIVTQLQDDRLIVIREYCGYNVGAKRFAAHVRSQIAIEFPYWANVSKETKSWVDPSGLFRNPNDESTCGEHIAASGFTDISPGPIDPETRQEAVTHFLTLTTRHGPGFQICDQTAPTLVSGFEGGYHFPENAVYKNDDKKPEKNLFSHPHDGLQYVAAGARGVLDDQRRQKRSIPGPSYFKKRA